MKKLLFLFLCIAFPFYAQQFVVKKVSGDAKYLRGISEKWEIIEEGMILEAQDLILTEKRSIVQLIKGSENFVLKGDAAIGLDHVKNVSLNDLILALTLDEIRNVPKKDKNDASRNTAVYGSKQSAEEPIIDEKILGNKKVNGAKQLNENGYSESSIIAAKEVFRNYPEVAKNIEHRLYFADLLSELKLYEEAVEDYRSLSAFNISREEANYINKCIEELSLKIMENN